jgi:outer membrane protein
MGVNGSWTLFDGTRMFVAKNRLQNQAAQQYMVYKLEVDNRMAEVMRFFYLTAFEMERRALFESNLEFSRERVRIAEQTYEIGKASKLELLQAKVDYNTDQTLLIQQQELLASQKLALLRAIGKNFDSDFSVNYSMEIDSTLELNDLISKTLAQNPAILVQQYAYTIAQQQAEELEKSRYPEINLNAGYSFSNLNSEAGFLLRNQSTGFNYGLSARVNVFDGFNQKRLIQNARLQAESSQIAIDNSINLITTTLKTSYNSYQNNLYLRKIEAENLDVALENADIALERFKIGVSSSLQLREAQVNAVNAQIRYLQASFLAKQAEIELKRLSGMLSVIED